MGWGGGRREETVEVEGGRGEKEGSSLLTQYETKGAAWKSVLIVAAGLTTVCVYVCVLGALVHCLQCLH